VKNLIEQYAERDIFAFLDYYKITNDQAEPLDFKDHQFLLDIFADFTPQQAILKAAQIGFSTTANIKALWLAKNKGMDIIYSLPTTDDARQFVSSKTNRLIANNPIFQTWTADHDSIEQKKVGENMMYWRGTWIEKAAISIPADLYIADEVDRSKQDTVKLFSSRLQHSKFAWQWWFSNPSAPGVGVDQYWQKSDQKEWFVKCDNAHWQYLTMDNVLWGGQHWYFGCTTCKGELDRRNGHWVKRWEDKDISGYHISLLMCPWVSADAIMEKKRTEPEQQFTNFVLGLPYVGKGNILTQQALFANLSTEINPQTDRCVIGVDNGSRITYVMGNRRGLFYNGEATDFSELDGVMRRFPNAVMCIDPHGNEIATKKLQADFPGRVYRVYSTTPRKNDKIAQWNEEDQTVVVDRDKLIQLVVDEFTERRIPLQGTQEDWWDYWIHWSRLYRTVEENNLGVEVFHWEKAAVPCDFPFATFYWRVMIDRFIEDRVSFVGPSPASEMAMEGIEMRANNTAFFPKHLLR